MILNSPYISGSLIVTSNGTVSGSLTVLGGITGAITGSATSASYAVSASEASKLQGLGSASFAPASTFNTVSQSYAASSATLSIRVTNVEATASTNTQASASFATMSGSLSTRVTNLEATSSTVSSSFATTSGSIAGRVTLIEGQYATTGSNNFTRPQQISDVSNAISFTSTASLYTAGGLRVSKDSFISGTAYFNNVVVYGTSSIQYLTSSQVNVGANIINLNTQTPAVRYGGMAVADSGSNAGVTGSLLWDSEQNRWIYSNPSGSTYDGGMLISGPRNTTGLGNEVGTTSCALMMGQGGDHITSSAIFSYGNATCFYGQSFISSSGAACFASTVRVNGTLYANSAGSQLQIGGAGTGTLSGIFQGTNTDVLFIGDWNTATKGININVSSGNVGMGTNSPKLGLHVCSGASTAPATTGTTPNGIALFQPNDGNNAILIGAYPTSPFGNWVQSQSTAALGTTYPLILQPNGGNVGIGIASPLQTTANRTVTTINGTCQVILNLGISGVLGGYFYADTSGAELYSAKDLTLTSTGACSTLFYTNGSEKMRLTSGGNLGIGAASPIAKLHTCTAYNANNLQAVFGNSNGSINYLTYDTVVIQADDVTTLKLVERNVGSVDQVLTMAVGDGTSRISTTCSNLLQFFVGGSPAACGYNGLSGTNALSITSAGNVGIGIASPTYQLQVSSASGGQISVNSTVTNTWRGLVFQNNAASDGTEYAYIKYNATSGELRYYANPAAFGGFTSWYSNNTESMRLSAAGNLFVGASSNTGFASYHRITVNGGVSQGSNFLSIDNGTEYSMLAQAVNGAGYNGASAGQLVGRNTSTLRSINAGGTVNASGTDYAEYMTKAVEDAIAKGDIVGVDSNGLLTNIFADSVSFVVKSTNPSYVGGDTWGSVDVIGKLPIEATEEEKAEYQAKLEIERAKVDRIAFSGQVPCNVLGANVGDYIIPIELENGKVGGQAVANPTLDQYRISVGRVWKIMEDGRAWIAVKIG